MIARAPHPLVIDADGITALGDAAAARQLLATRRQPTVLTPHDGEFARVAGAPPGDDRLAAARDLARRVGAIVLLKGPLTAVAAPQGEPPDVLLAAAGVPALATAGTGDVLSGVIGAFLGARRPGPPGRRPGRPRPWACRRPGTARGPGGRGPARTDRGLAERGWAPWLRTSSSCSGPA